MDYYDKFTENNLILILIVLLYIRSLLLLRFSSYLIIIAISIFNRLILMNLLITFKR